MSRYLSPERRRVVVMGGAIAAGSAGVATMQERHPWIAGVWLGLMAVALVYVITQLVKIKRQRR